MKTITHLSELDLTKEYTFSDYLQWQFSERVELLKGFIKQMSPAPSRRHQTTSQNINKYFLNFFTCSTCSIFSAPFDVRLPIASAKRDTTVVQPDLCIICDESKLDDYGCNGAPDLIVEIVSPNNSKYDVDTKFRLYQEAGVMEYWIVQTEMKTVLVYRLQDGVYVGSKPFAEGEIIESPLFPEMKIAVDEVFYRV
jgi:Uma2 family endonuclease